VYVWLDDDQDTGGKGESGTLIFAKDETIAELRERVASLERQLETRSEGVWRKDHIIAALTQRTPELSPGAHQERAQDTPQDVAEGAGEGKRPDPSVEAFRRTPEFTLRALGAGGKEFSATARKVDGSLLDLRPMGLHHEG
jgi:hypothetical protein